jgi:hypothetical protein
MTSQPDPFWDDDEGDSPSFNFEGDDDEVYEDGGSAKLYKVPEDDNQIVGGMKAWVGAVIADLGVCPFTVDADKAGAICGRCYSPTSTAVSHSSCGLSRPCTHVARLV